MLESYAQTQHHFTHARRALKHADKPVLMGKHDPDQLEWLTRSASLLNSRLGQIDPDKTAKFVSGDCRILAPDGDIYDRKVQWLLAFFSCLRNDDKVRMVYYAGSRLVRVEYKRAGWIGYCFRGLVMQERPLVVLNVTSIIALLEIWERSTFLHAEGLYPDPGLS